MVLNLIAVPMVAKCAVCIAQETPNGWWWFGGIVLVGAVAAAAWMVWSDDRSRRGA